MAYNLPKPPPGYRTDCALIVAPYFDLWFASRIVEQLKPRRIRFVVDDGAHYEDITKLIEECGNGDVRVALGRAAGIVHLKLYYIEFLKTKGGGIRKRLFIFGSANATEAAFGGAVNAELIAEAELSSKDDAELIRYLTSISNAVESARGGLIQVVTTRPSRNLPALFLPAFEIRALGAPPGFDAWLQRGRFGSEISGCAAIHGDKGAAQKSLTAGRHRRTIQSRGPHRTRRAQCREISIHSRGASGL